VVERVADGAMLSIDEPNVAVQPFGTVACWLNALAAHPTSLLVTAIV
jgi:hypothetical protein